MMKKLSLVLTVLAACAAGSVHAADRKGEAVFGAVCTGCHSAGVMGAPKLGSKSDWAPRIAQGKPTLYQHALAGYKGMPPRGTCTTCTDQEIKNAVDYMVGKAK